MFRSMFAPARSAFWVKNAVQALRHRAPLFLPVKKIKPCPRMDEGLLRGTTLLAPEKSASQTP